MVAILIAALLAAPHESVEEIENFKPIGARIYNGAQPAPEDFALLAELGVKTIVSVDGARPDVQSARAAGLQYIHIPIGYDAVELEHAAALKKTLEERDGPFYIHCHHGKHRGPALAAVGLMLEGEGDNEDAEALLEACGTSPDYAGLWQSIREFDAASLEGLDPELHEVAPVAPVAQEMAAIGEIWDRLKAFQANDWALLEDEPDAVPSREALQMEERLKELHRHGDGEEDAAYQALMEQGWRAAEALRQALERGEGDTEAPIAALAASCCDCHHDYRN